MTSSRPSTRRRIENWSEAQHREAEKKAYASSFDNLIEMANNQWNRLSMLKISCSRIKSSVPEALGIRPPAAVSPQICMQFR